MQPEADDFYVLFFFTDLIHQPMLYVYVLCNVNCVLPLIFPLFLPSFNRERSRKKLQTGTVVPGVFDVFREFSEN